ncbi:SurA N-terminal domain-containing protein [Candidatus Colwellia aromaticivorans]|uniref:SurA N-terminal domain-containing protein n=1 Tax=Candidatus Colwellia aromaticivorans TaxID=2267621 RepID=UPI000DF2F69C|nr:SurA N-terminal domain-containing protein [Candidatus Colwellia aromaticivorans]
MLENIRESSQGMTAKIILGLIILTFAVAGLGSYTNSTDTSIATVNGEKISQQEFNKAYQSQRNRMAQQFGDMFDTLSNDSNYMANFRQGVLDNLINERLIDQSAESLAIRVSDERLKKTIREMPEFQVDGVFDNNRYLAIINQSGFFQSSNFRDYLRVEMTRRQLSQALVSTEFNLPYQEKLQLALQNQTRDIRFATISAKQFEAGIDVSEEEIKTYYQANQIRFENKEQVKVDYIRLSIADIAKNIQVSDEEVASYYQDNIASFTQAEQRRVSHILIEFTEGDSNSEATAKTQAETVLARIAQGEDFAELAKELSNDTFSGENGGDLDFLEVGVMESSFDTAAFALTTVGDITELVKTSFGYHVIKLTELKTQVIQSLADVKTELLAKVSNDKAQEEFYTQTQEMARVSFEFPDSLEDAASEVNTTIETSTWLANSGLNTNSKAPFNNPKVLEAAFSDLVLQDNMNSDIIELNDNEALVLRLNTYQEANVKPLVEVQAQIEKILVAQKATEKAQSTIQALLVQFKAGNDITEELTKHYVSFTAKENVGRYSADLDQSITREAFVLPHPTEGTISASTVALSNGDLALVEVQAVNVVDSIATPQLAQQQTSQLAQSAYKSYVDSLKIGAEITHGKVAEPTNY